MLIEMNACLECLWVYGEGRRVSCSPRPQHCKTNSLLLNLLTECHKLGVDHINIVISLKGPLQSVHKVKQGLSLVLFCELTDSKALEITRGSGSRLALA